MKRFILLISALLLAATALHAQAHLEFKGVPIDGTTKSVAAQLETVGFSIYKVDNGRYYMEGTFSGQDATIVLVPTVQTQTCWKVKVYLESSLYWSKIKSSYNIFKDNLSKKYTKKKSYEYFSAPYKEGDGYETTAICAEKCIWKTFYTANNSEGSAYGNILLEVSNVGNRGGIVLSYEDAANSKLYTAEKNMAVAKDL